MFLYLFLLIIKATIIAATITVPQPTGIIIPALGSIVLAVVVSVLVSKEVVAPL